jgi:glycosyltransferase involved in cell wall biosynthesis
MKVSLIVATRGRDIQLVRLLASIDAQSHRDVELIVVDQNDDDRVGQVLNKAQNLPNRTVHLHEPPGLSRARNAGLREVQGDIVAFPDDDCWYPPGALLHVVRRMREEPRIDVLTGRFVDELGHEEIAWSRRERLVDRWNVWSSAISFTIFARKSTAVETGFDPNLGIGAGTPFGSGEETDFLLRCLAGGRRIVYDPNLVMGHPVKSGRGEPNLRLQRAQSYAPGFGRVLRQHRYPLWYVGLAVAKPVADAVLATVRMDFQAARFFGEVAKGRLHGWLAD